MTRIAIDAVMAPYRAGRATARRGPRTSQCARKVADKKRTTGVGEKVR